MFFQGGWSLERFPNGDPRLKALPHEVWINPPPATPEVEEIVLPKIGVGRCLIVVDRFRNASI